MRWVPAARNMLRLAQPGLPGHSSAVRRVFLIGLWAALWAWPSLGQAAGLYLAPRGVRPLARAGAYVAGVEDVHALSYNPAGLAWAPPQLLLDAALPLHQTRYTRRVYPNAPPLQPVRGTGLALPSPTLGLILASPWGDWLKLGLGLDADYPLMQNWPSAQADPDTPQRYAAGDYRGTALVHLSGGLAVAPTAWLALGLGVDLLVGSFASLTTLSTCDGAHCALPEDPDYDAAVHLRAAGLLAPALHVGLQLRPLPWLRFGLAWRSASSVDHAASMQLQLPRASAYAGARLQPAKPQVRVHMRLPWIGRAGVEVRGARARLELAYVYERWSLHDRITLKLTDVSIQNLFPVGTYPLADSLQIARNFRDTWSLRLGGAWRAWGSDACNHAGLRLGIMVEPSAIPTAALTAMAVDLDKLLLTGGLFGRLGRFRIEGTLAYVKMFAVEVRDSTMLQINPTRPPWEWPHPHWQRRLRQFGLGAGPGQPSGSLMPPQLHNGQAALVLAPMEGVTDAPMRALLTEGGAFTFCVSEFLRISQAVPPPSAFAKHVPELADGACTPAGTPVQVQLLGGDPSMLAESALAAVAAGAQAIDLNFGCPARTVNRRDGGASLLRHPRRIRAIVATVRQAVPAHLPVSAKLRLGWDDPVAIHENADMAAQGGAAWLTIHGRTRAQGYRPPAYWQPIGAIRRRLALPIVANGDIWTLDDLQRCRDESLCEHFMLGRGALADPQLPRQAAAALGLLPAQGRLSPPDWPQLLHQFAQLAGACLDRPKYIPGRIKQWLKMSHQRQPNPWYDPIKVLHSRAEIFALLDQGTPPP